MDKPGKNIGCGQDADGPLVWCWCGATVPEGKRHYPGGGNDPEYGPSHLPEPDDMDMTDRYDDVPQFPW